MHISKNLNEKKIVILLPFILLCISMFINQSALNGQETFKPGKWIKLFNGKNLGGWAIKIAYHPLNENSRNTFRVENGIMKACYDNYDSLRNEFGHIFYKHKFSSYRIRVEYRFTGELTPGSPEWDYRNSGIMIHSQSPESMEVNQEFPVSIEVQLLGGNGKDERTTANVCTPGTNIVINKELITRHITNSTSKTYHGDQWVTVEVEVHGNRSVKHIIDGVTVLEYQNPQLDETDPYAKKLLAKGQPLMLSDGYIALQAEGHPVEFRNVEIFILEEK